MNNYVDPEIQNSFRRTDTGFISRGPGFTASPAYTIAVVARARVTGELNLPQGYDDATLEQVEGVTGWVGTDVHVDPRQATELASLGQQILELNEQGMVEPPLGYYEEQSVRHLVSVVGRTALNE